MEVKGFSTGIEIKDADSAKGIVTGYLAHFGSKDNDGDVIEQGAFTKSINENGPKGKGFIKYLLDHNTKNSVGVFTELKEDATGLYYEAKVGRHTAGRDYLLMVEDGIINQHSIGFTRIKQEVKSDAKYIKEVKLFEGSGLQFWAANGNTPITSVKEMSDVIERLTLLNKSLRAGEYTDEAFKAIETEINIINESIKSLTEAKAADSTLSNDEPNLLTALINVLQKN